MSGEDEFTPHLGHIRDRGAAGGKRFKTEVNRAARRLARTTRGKPFSGVQIGRGSGAGRASFFRKTPYPKFRMRRVVVKVHIARAAQGIGRAAYGAHLKYIQRDGVDREGEGGELYGPDQDRIDDEAFLSRSEGDRHQFRFIVSAEDAGDLSDLKATTRALMLQAEKDLGTRLDWVAVDHHNTGQLHTHIVVRGKDQLGRDLILARDYLMEGLRERASVLVTEELGPRRDLEIARAREKEVSADRFTSLDRRIETLAKDGQIDPGGPTPPGERFEQALIRRRLAYLGKLGLAAQRNDQPWRLEDAWNQRLRQMGREGDRIREIAAAFSSGDGLAGKVYDPMRADAPTITGRVVADGPVDELRNRRYLIIDGLDGERWHVSIGEHAPGALPPRGAIVELSPAALGPRSSDRTIARIAALHGGAYSDALHETLEPAASTDYRRAHVRRLEALRRAGIVTRDGDGTFRIGGDYLRRASAHDAVRSGGVKIEVKSWLPTETLINRRAPTWLDSLEAGSGSDVGYGKEVAAARMARRAFLDHNGLLRPDGEVSSTARSQLAAEELQSAAARIRDKGAFLKLEDGMSMNGVYERPIDLAQGRLALVARSKEFTLVPWRPEMERYRGAEISIKSRGRSIGWTVGRAKKIGR